MHDGGACRHVVFVTMQFPYMVTGTPVQYPEQHIVGEPLCVAVVRKGPELISTCVHELIGYSDSRVYDSSTSRAPKEWCMRTPAVPFTALRDWPSLAEVEADHPPCTGKQLRPRPC